MVRGGVKLLKISVILDVSNVEKQSVSKILHKLKKYECRAFKYKNKIRLEFDFDKANSLTLEEFVDILKDTTDMNVHIKVIKGKMVFKFVKEKGEPSIEIISTQ